MRAVDWIVARMVPRVMRQIKHAGSEMQGTFPLDAFDIPNLHPDINTYSEISVRPKHHRPVSISVGEVKKAVERIETPITKGPQNSPGLVMTNFHLVQHQEPLRLRRRPHVNRRKG
jgi:hypothetical protein